MFQNIASNHQLQTSQKVNKQTMKKFINFIEFHSLQANLFWEGNNSLPVMLFIDTFEKKTGYHFSLEQINSLRILSSDSSLKKENFSCLNLWTKQEQPIYEKSINTSASCKLLNNFTYETHKTEIDENKDLDNDYQRNSVKFQEMKGSKSKKRTICEQMDHEFLKTGYTIEQCKDSRLKGLREDMEMNALQKKWDFIVMAGQMNKWIESSSSEDKQPLMTVFKIINYQTNFTILKTEGNYEQIVPEVVFIKRYKAMKKKKQSPKVFEAKQINKALLDMVESNTGKNQPVNSINQREKQLNQALLHIMRVRNTLQHQHRILSEAAINT